MRFTENMFASFDEKTIQSVVDVGSYPDLTKEEIEAIDGHRIGNQSALLRENYFIHRNRLTVTKSIDEALNITKFIETIIDSCHFRVFQCFIGKYSK